MFESKKTKLFETKSKGATAVAEAPKKSKSVFVQAGLKKSAEGLSGNGALKYTTTGNTFVDQFGNLSNYKKPRAYAEIERDCELLWAENKLMTVCFIFFIRMINRVVQLFDGTSTEKSQKGGELRHEGIMRMIWLHQKAPKTFMKNIGLFVSVGSWKDIITMLQYDLIHHNWDGRVLNWNELGDLILSGLKNEKTSNLVKKYLPQIKANSACKTVEAQADNMIAKWVCSLLFGNKENAANYKKYRQLKTSGTAHQWQKLISQRKFNEIDFNSIHGRALNKLVRSKFLANNGLTDAYAKWVGNDETEVKYTGYVHELFANLTSGYPRLSKGLSSIPKHEQDTINKQFDTLVNKVKDVPTETRLIVVRDTSSSMTSTARGTNMSAYSVSKAIALYFSAFLTGTFADAWIEFDNDAEMRQWKGKTALEKWFNDNSEAYGGTNFMGVINLFCRLKRQGVALEDFPNGIICISDMQFNSVGKKTNYETAKKALLDAGFPQSYVDNFVFCFWHIPNDFYGSKDKAKFETFGDCSNVFYMSGYSTSIVSFLMTGKVTNANELFKEAMNQEVLNLLAL